MIIRVDDIPRALDLSSVEAPTGIESATMEKEKIGALTLECILLLFRFAKNSAQRWTAGYC